MPAIKDGHHATVTILREPGFFGSAGSLIFGADGNDYLSLYNGEYTTVELPPSRYIFFVRTTGADRPFTLPALLSDNQALCLKAYVNPSDYAKVIFPLSYYVDSDFKMEATPCPSADAMKAYRKAGSEEAPDAQATASK